MIIDLSSYYKNDLTQKLEKIRQAIKESKCITFHYCYNKGEANKQIEPYLIVFKWSDWYLFGFCKERQDFRMYKLRRLWNLQITDEVFTVRNISEDKKQFSSHITDDYIITALYEPSDWSKNTDTPVLQNRKMGNCMPSGDLLLKKTL